MARHLRLEPLGCGGEAGTPQTMSDTGGVDPRDYAEFMMHEH